MTKETFYNIDKKYSHIKKFILKLVAEGIELEDININDFSSSYPYRVYVGILWKKNGHKEYIRFSNYDAENCLKWFRKQYPTFVNYKFS